MNDAFQKALNYTIKNEAGFVDDPLDAGGATNYGITQITLGMWLRRAVSKEDIKSLSFTLASEIYFGFYWCPLSCPLMDSPTVATVIFDAGVLFGVGTSARFAQKALRELKYFVTVDGHIGPKTREALAACSSSVFIRTFRLLLYRHIENIIAKEPTNVRFEKGWKLRLDRYLALLGAET